MMILIMKIKIVHNICCFPQKGVYKALQLGQGYIQEATSGLVSQMGVFLQSVLGYHLFSFPHSCVTTTHLYGLERSSIWKLPVLPALPGVLAIPVEPAIPVLFTVPPVVSKEISHLKIRITVHWKCPLGCVKINRNQQ